jgi:hypothetical protein
MKGTILVCLRDMLVDTYKITPKDWADIMAVAGLDRNMLLLASVDINDQNALQLFGEAQSRYFTSHEQMADAFGHYWCVTYAPAIYKSVYQRFSNARDFILGMDQVHVQVTQSIPNAKPPRFKYTHVGANKLLVEYQSHRGLVHIYAGLCRGIGTYFGQTLKVDVLGPNQVSIEFPA